MADTQTGLLTVLGKQFWKTIGTALDPSELKETAKIVDKSFSEVANTLGQGRENVLGIKKSLTDAVSDVLLLGGSWQDVVDIQKDFVNTVGRGSLLTKQSFSELKAIKDVTGLATSTVTDGFRNAGMSVLQANKELNKVVEVSRSLGISVQKVSSEVVNNLDATNKFNFQNGIEGMARMAAQAVNLRMDMRDTLRLAENLFDPEKAIEMAAGLQRLGVQQSALLDPLRLMDLAQNDPEELQNQLAEMSKEFVRFNETNKKFEIMPGAKRRLIEIERQLSMTPGSLSKIALASSELEDKMSRIKLPRDTFTEEQRQFIANMAQMGPGGEYMLKVDNKDLGLDQALELFKKDSNTLTQFMKASEKKTIEELAKEQLDTERVTAANTSIIANSVKYGFAGSEINEQLIDTQRTLAQSLPVLLGKKEGQQLDASSMRRKFDQQGSEFLDKMAKGELGLGTGALSLLDKAVGNLTDIMATAYENLPEYIKEIRKNDNKVIDAAIGGTAATIGTFDYLGINTGAKTVLEDNQRRMKEREELSGTNKGTTKTSEYETKSKVDVNYGGKIEISVKPEYGLTTTELQKLLEDPKILEQLKLRLPELQRTGYTIKDEKEK